MPAPTIVVFCHLRWDFVFQRPQHLLTRLAQHFNVLVVEEPVHHDGGDFLKKTVVADNITICRPHTACHEWGFHDAQISHLQPLLADLVPEGVRPIVWFYTPMALPLLQGLDPSLIVYDCMDELSAFKNPPKQLLQRESALLGMADVVFTGGPSLYEAKRTRHDNVYCFSSSVDAAHFGRALDRSISAPQQAHLPHPRLGFYGVIDERFDIDMLRSIADARPEWQLVMVGPIVKIDQAQLPRNANIHYMGQANYDELPAYLAGWDVCLMPFAMNESTKFISPTKVLEYMAAELPIVSTPVNDVKVPYGHVVAIAETADAFIAACDAALAMTPDQTARMVQQEREIVANTSWDRTAKAMQEILLSTVRPDTAEQVAANASINVGAVVNALPTHAALQPVAAAVKGKGVTAAALQSSDTVKVPAKA
jgi:glycosyltransferase involved in cell wall biosynthesis